MLIVDDHPANLKLLDFVLARQGYEVRTAPDAEEALKMLQDWQPRMILLDLQMPGMGGLEMARRLKADPATQGILLVAVTGAAMKGDDQIALEFGCDAYLSKPIDTRTLPDFVAQLLVKSAPPGVL
ncbi:response regulator [Actinoplanes sp. KI2]|uniref:response regulator n=1 Tax=Actinoplanes sp. KI2 TaxID=2983315 RepID=UPI0021D5E4EE|nr:response regulator [Actinoplanes sp. KI2]MCU7729312.1 response regulator [Actinoplanes sp. KI2]